MWPLKGKRLKKSSSRCCLAWYKFDTLKRNRTNGRTSMPKWGDSAGSILKQYLFADCLKFVTLDSPVECSHTGKPGFECPKVAWYLIREVHYPIHCWHPVVHCRLSRIHSGNWTRCFVCLESAQWGLCVQCFQGERKPREETGSLNPLQTEMVLLIL